MDVERTSNIYKIKRVFKYILEGKLSTLIKKIYIRSFKNYSSDLQKQYGHTIVFTEKELLDIVSIKFKIIKLKYIGNIIFIMGEKYDNTE